MTLKWQWQAARSAAEFDKTQCIDTKINEHTPTTPTIK